MSTIPPATGSRLRPRPTHPAELVSGATHPLQSHDMPGPVDVTLVTATGCHLCIEAERLLEELSETIPLAVRTVSLLSDEGRDLAVRHRVPFPPIMIIRDVFFGYGRVSRRKLENHLTRLADEMAV